MRHPGHDHPGEEVQADVMRVDDDLLSREVQGRCGFASDFDDASDGVLGPERPVDKFQKSNCALNLNRRGSRIAVGTNHAA